MLDLLFPRRCVVCGQSSAYICFACANEIQYLKTPVCLKCGKITKNGEFCSTCRSKYHLYGIIYSTTYDCAPVKELLHHLKYNGIVEIGELLGDILAARLIGRLPFKNMVVVPVPLFRKREQQRGYNQAELIARRLSKRLNLPGGLALERIKNTSTQVGLHKKERELNVAGDFKCIDSELITGKVVILVDDVVTTGSTMNECAAVLKAAGAKKVIGAAVAKRV